MQPMNMDIADISNELVYRTYLINKDRIWEKLSDLSIIEYVALHRLAQDARDFSHERNAPLFCSFFVANALYFL
jgi:hypothetical protein